MNNKNKSIITNIFIVKIFLIIGILLGKIIRREIMGIFPRSGYLFFNEIKYQNYFQQRYIFSYLKLKQIEIFHSKIIDDMVFLEGTVFVDNPTNLKCLAPIVQYKIIWVSNDQKKNIILDQNYHKLTSTIPSHSMNHKIQIKIAQKIHSNLWKKLKNKKGKVIMIYKLIERYQ